ncbi:unnamed protein product [Caretta caretta]
MQESPEVEDVRSMLKTQNKAKEKEKKEEWSKVKGKRKDNSEAKGKKKNKSKVRGERIPIGSQLNMRQKDLSASSGTQSYPPVKVRR